MRISRFILWGGILFGLYWMFNNLSTVVKVVSSITHKAEQLGAIVTDNNSNTITSEAVIPPPVVATAPVVKTIPSTSSDTQKVYKYNQEPSVVTTSPIPQTIPQTIQQTIPQTPKITPEPKIVVKTPVPVSKQNDTGRDNKARNDLHDSAKQSVNDGQLEFAIKKYQNLLAQYPKIAEAWGELGDVFHLLGETNNAAMAYGNSAFLFRKQGNMEIVGRLMLYIDNNAPAIASQLRNYR